MASPSQNNGVSTGPAIQPQSTWGDYNNILFVIQQAIALLQTVTLVRVESCTNDGDTSPVGMVDVTALVNQIDGQGNPTPHVIAHNLPYLRIQGGNNAVIIDPQPGDIGIALFASRDISKVKTTKAQANPGSLRQFDFADGLYIGGLLNGAPQQYVLFNNDGITIVSPQTITLQASNIVLKGAVAQSDGDVTMAQKLTVTDDVTGAGISLRNHVHTSEAPGTPTSPPTP